MSTVISVENLSKKYTISHQQRGDNSSLREIITNSVTSFGRKILSPFTRHSSPLPLASDFPDPCPLTHDPAVEDFWALKDVSFEVKQGERIGIIGRNGAGKSTLLKILSRITEPTTGRVKIKGRVASLLEVGTGFHPELTGRENIYLNGAILGMGRQEISRKFDEIVSFAEIEKFLDTPVKRYSSGMYVRLAFAVAAHLEPEILIVDEVLAVGDAQFQKKCLGKMEAVGREGRTVLFVSHNMGAVKHLCSRALVLRSGCVVGSGDIQQQIDLYLKPEKTISKLGFENNRKLGNGIILQKFELTPNPVASHGILEFLLELRSTSYAKIDALSVLIYSSLGTRVAVLDLRNSQGSYVTNSDDLLLLIGKIRLLPLVEGTYRFGLFIDSGNLRDNFYDLLELSVIGRPPSSEIAPYPANVRGYLDLDYFFDVSEKVSK